MGHWHRSVIHGSCDVTTQEKLMNPALSSQAGILLWSHEKNIYKCSLACEVVS